MKCGQELGFLLPASAHHFFLWGQHIRRLVLTEASWTCFLAASSLQPEPRLSEESLSLDFWDTVTFAKSASHYLSLFVCPLSLLASHGAVPYPWWGAAQCPRWAHTGWRLEQGRVHRGCILLSTWSSPVSMMGSVLLGAGAEKMFFKHF